MAELQSERTETGWPAVYQIRIEGHLGRAWTNWFAGLSIALEDNGDTLLTGDVADQAALYGLLKKVRDLGVPLVSVNRLEPCPSVKPVEGEIEMSANTRQTTETKTPTYRANAIAVGVLFIVCSVATVLSVVPLGATVGAPVDFAKLVANDNAVVMTALIEFVWAAAGMGIAIGLYPVLRKFSPALALGSVFGRVAENLFLMVGTLSLLVLLTVSQQAVASGASSSLQAIGSTLVAVREWVSGFVAMIPFVVGSFLYFFVLYRSKLVPRWLSGWGLVAIVLSLVGNLMAGFTQQLGFATASNLLSIPIGLQELALAVWLIAKGFNLAAVRSIAPDVSAPPLARQSNRAPEEVPHESGSLQGLRATGSSAAS